jgi:hypothetical protein
MAVALLVCTKIVKEMPLLMQTAAISYSPNIIAVLLAFFQC